ncbi:MAG: CoA protein activase [Deltaproteobacteria bacterium]|nr:CoA protein activase [Deltaproteobacteria bacterium]
MVVTFPHLGSMHIFCKAIAETAGIPYIVPPTTSRRTLSLGVKYSNESVCLPFKIILGNFIEALEKGADTIVMVESGPPCRLGVYDLIHKIILKDLGYSFRWLTIPSKFDLEFLIKNYHETKELKKELTLKNFFTFPYALYMGWLKMIAVERLEKLAMLIRAREEESGITQKRLKKALGYIDEAKNKKDVKEALKYGEEYIHKTPQDKKRNILKVGIVGELYTVMDPLINRGVEIKLGEMGVEVTRSSWFSYHIMRVLKMGKKWKRERENYLAASKRYLEYNVGAECNISVGEAIIKAKEGYDGIVHLMPFSCMPESTATPILEQVSKDFSIPILTLILDEQDIEGRILTLLEAFVDMIKWRKKK